ncbi:MAG: DegV family EDD domain-containing protein [Gemmatimonadota bacterium]|nr:MAG: DegV family EDD domain-containing protein [Gemmatimonadota bacterium]
MHRAELDRINVFPIPDGDTGTNLALTLRAIADVLDGVEDQSVAGMAARIAEAGVLGARGNSGMMLSHYFIGFADGLDGRARAGPEDLAGAMCQASRSLYQAVDDPIEGTILTVVRESTEEIDRLAPHVPDLRDLAGQLLQAALASLERTPDLLPVLRQANVVDAGAKGFVCFLEGMVSYIEGRSEPRFAHVVAPQVADAAAAAEYPEDTDRAYRYCAEFIVRGDPIPGRPQLAAAVRELGGSLIVNRASSVAKIHIHTNEPDEVGLALAGLAGSVECVKAEDMRAQHRGRQLRPTAHLAVVTDTTCDLPLELILEHGITVAPLSVMFGDEAFLDQVDIAHEEFLERLVDPEQPLPTTSQPAPAHLNEAYRRAAEHADEVLGLFVSGTLSGTLGQAEAAAARFPEAKVTIHDSRSASLGLGLQVLRAAELAAKGWEAEDIVAELERLRDRSGLFITVDTLDYLQRSGRLGKAHAFLGNLFDLKPILSVDREGYVVPVDRVRHREALIPRVLELLSERVPAERARLRMGVAHVLCQDVADELASEMERAFAPDELLVRPATSVIAAHTGPGAWGVFYQAE